MSAREHSKLYREQIRKQTMQKRMQKMRQALSAKCKEQHLVESLQQKVKGCLEQQDTEGLYVACFRNGHVSQLHLTVLPLYHYVRSKLDDLKCALLLQSLISNHYKSVFTPDLHLINSQVVSQLIALAKKWIQLKTSQTDVQQKCINIYLACLKSIVLHTEHQSPYAFTAVQDYILLFVQWIPLLYDHAQFLIMFTLLSVDMDIFRQQHLRQGLQSKLIPLLALMMGQVTVQTAQSIGVQSATLVVQAFKEMAFQTISQFIKPVCSMAVQIYLGSRPQSRVYQQGLFRSACKTTATIFEIANLSFEQHHQSIRQAMEESKLLQIIGVLLQIECVQERVVLFKLIREMLKNQLHRNNKNPSVITAHVLHLLCQGLQSQYHQIILVSLECIECICRMKHSAIMQEYIEDFFFDLDERQLKYVIQSLEYHRNNEISELSHNIVNKYIPRFREQKTEVQSNHKEYKRIEDRDIQQWE